MRANRQTFWWGLAALSIVSSTVGIGSMAFDWFIRARDNHLDTSEHKLIDCTNRTLSVHFVMQPAKSFTLLLGYPAGTRSAFTNQFKGQVEFWADNVRVASLIVESDDVQDANWLNHRGMGDAHILNWSSHKPGLASLLKPRRIYEMKVEFSQPPPTNSSLWAHFLQRHADVDRQSTIIRSHLYPPP
jgi:hypothetical protein